MISAKDMRNHVITPTLMEMNTVFRGAFSRAAVNLLVGTYAHESTFGRETRLKQVGGPALGVFQIEPETHYDNWGSYLTFRPDKERWMRGLMRKDTGGCPPQSYSDELITNLAYATAQARLVYWRERFDWPDDPNDIEALAIIWNDRYNKNPDKGHPEDFIRAYPSG